MYSSKNITVCCVRLRWATEASNTLSYVIQHQCEPGLLEHEIIYILCVTSKCLNVFTGHYAFTIYWQLQSISCLVKSVLKSLCQYQLSIELLCTTIKRKGEFVFTHISSFQTPENSHTEPYCILFIAKRNNTNKFTFIELIYWYYKHLIG